jgi:hypothetical protein
MQMGDGVLTKEMLDAETAAWREHRAALGYPVDACAPVAKGLTVPEVKVRDAAVIQAVMSAVAPVIYDLEKQIAALSARVAELEARPALKYIGVFRDDGRKYSEGSAITHDGGIWIALKATTERPNHSADWQLAVKSGGQPTANPRSDTAATSHARNGSAGGPARPRTP